MGWRGKDVTNPGLDLPDFIRSRNSPPRRTVKLYQLPDQQFANLYWFRYEWFKRRQEQGRYSRPSTVTISAFRFNWSAYEDIAEFSSPSRNRRQESLRPYGYNARRTRRSRWRFTDAWLSMAGNGDKGPANGLPVDEWGIKVNEKSQPVGSCVARGGDTNGPASVYAIQNISTG